MTVCVPTAGSTVTPLTVYALALIGSGKSTSVRSGLVLFEGLLSVLTLFITDNESVNVTDTNIRVDESFDPSLLANPGP